MSYLGNTPADKYQTLQKQSFTTSATDTYTLSYAVTNPQDLALFINNVRQNPNDAYTVSGTTLTLSSAISGSDTMYAVFLGRAVETVAPALSSVTNDMLAGSIATSKLAEGTNFGITMLDQFRLTANLTANADPISSNLERIDDATFSKIGTGMTLSSGIYTFPTTGLYQVSVNADFQISQDTTADCETLVSSNSGSSYDQTAVARGGEQSSSFANFTSNSQCFVNVTNASTFRVKFVLSGAASTDTRLQGSSTSNFTTFTFIRLGDNQ